ncbi:MAG: TIR domain-containing protein [Colwellia sp.]|nr:TIR domain-containing protein [Colwellia sp.]
MSAQTIINQISSTDREISNVERQIQTLDGRISSKQKEAHRILDKISREKDLKRLIKHQKDLTRKNDEISRIEKDKMNKTKTLSQKQKKKAELQQKLVKEEAKERTKTKKEQQEILSIQKQTTREIELQKHLSLQTVRELSEPEGDVQYDVFISHASEDKDEFVRSFANALISRGVEVWYDEFSLKIGDSLRRSIDKGLSNSRYGIVVLSNAFFQKEWPQKELDGLFAREVSGEKVILPIWHKISKDEVLNYSPMIADMVAINTFNFTVNEIAEQIEDRVNVVK